MLVPRKNHHVCPCSLCTLPGALDERRGSTTAPAFPRRHRMRSGKPVSEWTSIIRPVTRSIPNTRTHTIRILALALFTMLPFLVSCFVFQCAPYTCRQAEEGRALYAPLLASIEQYRDQNAVYPETLTDLVPDFVDGIPASASDAGPKFPEYRRVDDHFEFMFQYFGPGMNWCVYTPQDDWRCDGHF